MPGRILTIACLVTCVVTLLPSCRPKPAKQTLTGPPCVEGLPSSSAPPAYARSASTIVSGDLQGTKLAGLDEKLRDELGEAICQGYACEAVKASLAATPRTTDEEVCARLEVNRQALEEIQAKPQRDLDRALAREIDALVKHAPGQQRFALAGVWDNGAPGSHRADYVAGTLARSFSQKSLELVAMSEESADVDMIRAHIASVPGRKDLLDLKLELRRSGGRLVHTSEVISFPAMLSGLALDPESAREALTFGDRGGVTLSLVGGDLSGGLCDGASARLVMRASERVFVRVFMLYGGGLARMVWPRTPEDDVALLPGDVREVGAVYAANVPSQAQRRFYVIAAETVEGLGRFAQIQDRCEVSEVEARSMFKGLSYPPTALDRAFATGYRLSRREDCAVGAGGMGEDLLEARVIDVCGN